MSGSVSRSGADYYDIHIGFWTNWSHGRIQGSTLTITRQDGNLLVAFVALFVAASGKSLWRLLCFLLHRYYSSPTPQDGLYHQRQAILRNSENPEDGAFRLFQLLWVWRRKARRAILRLLPTAILALILGLALVVGGIFSAKVATEESSEVLISGKNCGSLDATLKTDDSNARLLQPFIAQKANAHANYAVQCYSNATNSEDCNLYVKPRLELKVQRNASCPFAEEMCKTQDQNMIVDTGYIDSLHDLGMNGPPSERFEMRYVYQCAPLVSNGFKRVYNGTKKSSLPDVVQYFYGNLTYPNKDDPEYTGFTHQVFRNFSNSALPAHSRSSTDRPEIQLGAVVYYGGIDEKGFDVGEFSPIPQLTAKNPNADVTILFLTTNGLHFSEPVDDLWYSAHQEGKPLSTVKQGTIQNPSYTADEPASALACTEAFQACNPHKSREEGCEPLQGDMAFQFTDGVWSEEQKAAIMYAGQAMYGRSPVAQLARLIGSTLLVGRYSSVFGLVGPIPNNLWQIEVENMIGASMASFQGSFVLAANGPPSEDLKQFQAIPDSETDKRYCKNQKVLSTRYTSFSVLGLGIIFLLGVILILLDLCLEPMINWFHIRKSKRSDLPTHHFTGTIHSRLEWRATGVLQLQRLAHAAVGSGTWFKTADETPVTLPFQKLGVLDVRNEECPAYRPLRVEEKAPSLNSKSSNGDLQIKTIDLRRGAVKEPESPGASTPRIAGFRRVRTGLSETTLAEDLSSPVTPKEAQNEWKKFRQ